MESSPVSQGRLTDHSADASPPIWRRAGQHTGLEWGRGTLTTQCQPLCSPISHQATAGRNKVHMLTSAWPKLPTQTSILMEMWMHHALGNKRIKKRINIPPGNQSMCVFKYVTTTHNRKNQEMMSISEKVDKHTKVNPHNGIVYPILKNEVEQHANINMYR